MLSIIRSAVRQQQSVARGDEAKKPEVPVGAVRKGEPVEGERPMVLNGEEQLHIEIIQTNQRAIDAD